MRTPAAGTDAVGPETAGADAMGVELNPTNAGIGEAGATHAAADGAAVEADAADAAIADVEEQMSVLAGIVRRRLRDAALSIDPALQPFGLKLLRFLGRYGPMRASGVAEALLVDKSVISRQARMLEELELLETQADPEDGRARLLALTPTAMRKIEESRAGGHAIIRTGLRDWSAEDIGQFAAYLLRLNTSAS